MKIYATALLLILLLASVLTVNASRSQTFADEARLQDQKVREKKMQENNETFAARFLIYTNGTQRILSAKKYLLQWPDAYLTSDAPTTIRVAKQGITWERFFQSIPLQVNATCIVVSAQQQFCTHDANTLKFYLNGKKDPDALKKEIHDGDALLVSYGAENQVELDKQLQALRELP